MDRDRVRHLLDDVAHELDLLVFRFEQEDDLPEGAADTWTRTRRELERLRDRLADAAQDI